MSISAETHYKIRRPDDGGWSSSTRGRSLTLSGSIGDEVLVAHAQLGDAEAYGKLYERYHPYIRKILNDDVGQPEARDDILQNVFEKGWAKISTLRDASAFRPWIAQLARRLIIDHYRTASRTIATDFTSPDEDYDLVSDEWSADDWVSMRELASALQVGIDGLSPRDATVLELATSFGFTSQEIAAALDIDVSHARVLLHRARKRLSRELVASYRE